MKLLRRWKLQRMQRRLSHMVAKIANEQLVKDGFIRRGLKHEQRFKDKLIAVHFNLDAYYTELKKGINNLERYYAELKDRFNVKLKQMNEYADKYNLTRYM